MQKRIEEEKFLLDENGKLAEKGYSTKMLLKYDRKMIKSSKLKIKEWDYYLIYNEKFGVAFTVADNGYMGLYSTTFLDFVNKTEITKTNMKFMPLGKTNMPSSSSYGNIEVKNKKYNYFFQVNEKTREINVYLKNFYKDESLIANIKLTDEPKDSMCIATPFWEKENCFYYNHKIIGYKAIGMVKIGNNKYDFEQGSQGILDWGRGVWPYKCTWLWGACAREISGKKFGFNIGAGFGDTSNASENMIFYDGIANKLEDVKFEIPKNLKGKDDFMQTWIITSSDGRLDLKFEPILDRYSHSSAIIISSIQHQIFGRYSGKIILDDGKKVEIKNLLGFAEKVKNRW